nr:uncharacterized protein LOC117225611 [Megalopta genalis]
MLQILRVNVLRLRPRMEVFDGNYKFYHTLMCLTGLWPYDKSILTYIQRFVVLVMTFTCIASQMTFVFDNMQRDFSQLKDPVELKILLEDSIVAKRIVQAYFETVKRVARNVRTSVEGSVTETAFPVSQFFISITESNDRDAVMLSVHFVMAYTTFICGNNYSGQLVLDSSGELFRETYNSLWYRIPAKMQKLVLFSLMRSRSDVAFNLAGLFTPCYEGFTMMMSSSFSYFTLLCSV